MKARLPQGYGSNAQNMNSMIKQAQKMQEEMEKAQEEIKAKEYSTTVGGGVVEITMTGDKILKSITLKPEVVDPEDIETLQDLIVSGENEVLRDISMIIPKGGRVLITAPSGRGKTTLLRIMMGLEAPDSGEIKNRPRRQAAVFQEDIR